MLAINLIHNENPNIEVATLKLVQEHFTSAQWVNRKLLEAKIDELQALYKAKCDFKNALKVQLEATEG